VIPFSGAVYQWYATVCYHNTHDITTQKTLTSIFTAMITSNLSFIIISPCGGFSLTKASKSSQIHRTSLCYTGLKVLLYGSYKYNGRPALMVSHVKRQGEI
jgi:hypothetical protein